jgi:hypothetical protein
VGGGRGGGRNGNAALGAWFPVTLQFMKLDPIGYGGGGRGKLKVEFRTMNNN